MTALNSSVLDLLGKQVSFTYVLKSVPDEYLLDCSGTVTSVVLSVVRDPEFFLDDCGDSYAFKGLRNFEIKG